MSRAGSGSRARLGIMARLGMGARIIVDVSVSVHRWCRVEDRVRVGARVGLKDMPELVKERERVQVEE